MLSECHGRTSLRPVRTAATLAALLLSSVLSGCGSDDPPPALEPAGRSAPAPSPTVTDDAATALSALPSAAATTGSAEVRLTGDGVDLPGVLLEFGAPFEAAQTALRDVLGAPTADSGPGPSAGAYGVCPGSTVRALEYGDGALVLLFGDANDPELRMFSWLLTDQGDPAAVPPARALVGDVTTYDLAVGASVADLRAGTTGVGLDVQPGDELVAASFRLQDQSSGLFGTLTSAADDGAVSGVVAGDACGE